MVNKHNFGIALLGRTKWLIDTGTLLHNDGFNIRLIITSKNADWDPVTPEKIKK
jgi:hypothetical protein